MKKKYFTLIEIMIVLIVVGLVVTFAIPSYHNILENAKAKACANNLDTILGALNTFGLENDELPATLGQLKQEHLNKAWAQKMQEKGAWKTKLAYFIIDLDTKGTAHAKSFVENFLTDSAALTCPSDLTPPGDGGHSYGLNQDIASICYTDFKALPGSTIIIADSNTPLFGDIDKRHKEYKLFSVTKYAQEIKKDKKVYKEKTVNVNVAAFSGGKVTMCDVKDNETKSIDSDEVTYKLSKGYTMGACSYSSTTFKHP